MVSRYSLLSALKTHFVNNALFIIVVLIARSLFFILGLLYLLNNVLYIIAWDSQLLILAIITQRVNNAKYLLWWYWKVSQGLAFQNRDLGTITNLISFVNKLITQWIINAPVFFCLHLEYMPLLLSLFLLGQPYIDLCIQLCFFNDTFLS